MKPKTKRVNKFDCRWEAGIWLGTREESGEHIIGTNEGVIKVRSFTRKSIRTERWAAKQFEELQGVPWRPVLGRGGDEIRIRIELHKGDDKDQEIKPPPVPAGDDYTKRRVRINMSDVIRFGYTLRCHGCRSISRGVAAQNHSQECRNRIEESLRKEGDERLQKAEERISRQVNKKRKKQEE